MTEYKIHPELAGLHRALTIDEKAQLEDNIVNDGMVIDPIVVWGEWVLDGRHRLPIAEKHSLPFDVKRIELEDLDAAKLWVVTNQLGKRNLTEQEARMLRARHAMLIGDLAETAKQHNVSTRTIRRDVEQAEAMDLMSPNLREKCERGEIINSRRDWREYAKLTPHQRSEVDRKLATGKVTMAQAIPSKDGAKLSSDQWEIVNNSAPLKKHRQAFTTGLLGIDAKSVSRFARLDDIDKEMVGALLDEEEIYSLSDALSVISENIKEPSAGERVEKVVNKLGRIMGQVEDCLSSLKLLKQDADGYEACSTALNSFRRAVQEWCK